VGVAGAVWRWRRTPAAEGEGDATEPEPRADPLDPEEARRLDAELAAFDR
jgi:hypothetical protein